MGSDPEERGVECEGGRPSSGDSQVSGDHGGPRRNVLQSGQGYGEFVHRGKDWGCGVPEPGVGVAGPAEGKPGAAQGAWCGSQDEGHSELL